MLCCHGQSQPARVEGGNEFNDSDHCRKQAAEMGLGLIHCQRLILYSPFQEGCYSMGLTYNILL